MGSVRVAALLLLLGPLGLLAASPAQAETLRCNGHSATEGDSRLSVFYKCGPPLLADSFCAPVYLPGHRHPLPEALARAHAPCVPVEAWLYDRGPGHLMATVHFRGGVVQSIRYGRDPR